MNSVSKTADLLTEWVFEGDLVSKMPHLLTEWVFKGDLVSKMPHLLTEWVFEIDLVSKMPYLLTEKGVGRGQVRRVYTYSTGVQCLRSVRVIR